MKCEKCGTEIAENSKFCSNCGEKITKKEPEIIEVEQLKENDIQEEKPGLSIASLILGIAAILCIFEHGILNITCAILAIVFGVIGRKKGGKGMGTTGMILGIASLALFFIMIALFIGLASSFIYLFGMSII